MMDKTGILAEDKVIEVFEYINKCPIPENPIRAVVWMSTAMKHFQDMFTDVYNKGFFDGVNQQVEGPDKK